MNNWQGQPGPGGAGRQGPGMQRRRFTPGDMDQTNQQMQPRGRGWVPGWGQGWTPDWEQNQQPEQTPDTNAPQGWGMNSRQGRPGPGGIGRQGPGMQQRRLTPEDTDQTNQPMPPRGRGWAPGSGPGWRQGWTPDLEPNQQIEKAPDANAPAEPVIENQPEQPQGE